MKIREQLWLYWHGFTEKGQGWILPDQGTLLEHQGRWYWRAFHRMNADPGNGPHDSAKEAAKALLAAT